MFYASCTHIHLQTHTHHTHSHTSFNHICLSKLNYITISSIYTPLHILSVRRFVGSPPLWFCYLQHSTMCFNHTQDIYIYIIWTYTYITTICKPKSSAKRKKKKCLKWNTSQGDTKYEIKFMLRKTSTRIRRDFTLHACMHAHGRDRPIKGLFHTS